MATPAGYRKVGRVLFVSLSESTSVGNWSQEAKLAALQLGLTAKRKTVVVPDIPQYRDLLLLVHPWVNLDARTTDECKEMLKVPGWVKWQDLRDNMPESEDPYAVMKNKVGESRGRFEREVDWLKQEMRERLGISYVKPGDNQPEGRTLFCFDDASKEYWTVWAKDKMRREHRWARFFPTPARGFAKPSAAEAVGAFMPRLRLSQMTTHERGVPMLGTTASRMTRRQRYGTFSPHRKLLSPWSDQFHIANVKNSFSISYY
eukprot:Hpha_TRINITY_DN15425_c3_g4::TRINITY_DN15425_c3_g4_i1::g.177130::m.177130